MSLAENGQLILFTPVRWSSTIHHFNCFKNSGLHSGTSSPTLT